MNEEERMFMMALSRSFVYFTNLHDDSFQRPEPPKKKEERYWWRE